MLIALYLLKVLKLRFKTKQISGPDSFIGDLYQTFKKDSTNPTQTTPSIEQVGIIPRVTL